MDWIGLLELEHVWEECCGLWNRNSIRIGNILYLEWQYGGVGVVEPLMVLLLVFCSAYECVCV